MRAEDEPAPRTRWRRSSVPSRLLRGVAIVVALLVVEFFVVPKLVGASKNLDLLSDLNVAWLAGGITFEAGSLICWALLTRVLLAGHGPTFSRQLRIVLATTALSHVVPLSGVGTAGLGYRLLTLNGVKGAEAGFVLATEAVGSAITLVTLLWVSLLVSIPVAGLRPVYAFIVVLGLLAILGAGALAYAFTRGEERAVAVVRRIGQRIPRLGPDRVERVVRDVGDSLTHLAHDHRLVRRAMLWAALNWLLDAASLWCFVAAFGHLVNPIELFVAYGVANVLAALPVTPGGLGVIEASAAALLVGFGLTSVVATLSVLAWRVVNFWLPIPLGALAYLSLSVPRGAGLVRKRRSSGNRVWFRSDPRHQSDSAPTPPDDEPPPR